MMLIASDNYEKILQPTEDRFNSTLNQFDEKQKALYDMAPNEKKGDKTK